MINNNSLYFPIFWTPKTLEKKEIKKIVTRERNLASLSIIYLIYDGIQLKNHFFQKHLRN